VEGSGHIDGRALESELISGPQMLCLPPNGEDPDDGVVRPDAVFAIETGLRTRPPDADALPRSTE